MHSSPGHAECSCTQDACLTFSNNHFRNFSCWQPEFGGIPVMCGRTGFPGTPFGKCCPHLWGGFLQKDQGSCPLEDSPATAPDSGPGVPSWELQRVSQDLPLLLPLGGAGGLVLAGPPERSTHEAPWEHPPWHSTRANWPHSLGFPRLLGHQVGGRAAGVPGEKGHLAHGARQ